MMRAGLGSIQVECCELVYKNWPYLFLVAAMPICAGNKLLIDYSNYYWEIPEIGAFKTLQARMLAARQELRAPRHVLGTLQLETPMIRPLDGV